MTILTVNVFLAGKADKNLIIQLKLIIKTNLKQKK